MKIPISMK